MQELTIHRLHLQIAIFLRTPSNIDYSHESIGSALVRFERSAHKDKDTRTVVLRFLKIITPVKCVIPNYDDFICVPKEGELFCRRRRGAHSTLDESVVWIFDIDKSNTASTM